MSAIDRDYETIRNDITQSQAAAAASGLRRAAYKDFVRAVHRRPRESSRADSKSRRDPNAPDYIVIGSFDSCDISTAIFATTLVRVDPPPEEPEE